MTPGKHGDHRQGEKNQKADNRGVGIDRPHYRKEADWLVTKPEGWWRTEEGHNSQPEGEPHRLLPLATGQYRGEIAVRSEILNQRRNPANSPRQQSKHQPTEPLRTAAHHQSDQRRTHNQHR